MSISLASIKKPFSRFFDNVSRYERLTAQNELNSSLHHPLDSPISVGQLVSLLVIRTDKKMSLSSFS